MPVVWILIKKKLNLIVDKKKKSLKSGKHVFFCAFLEVNNQLLLPLLSYSAHGLKITLLRTKGQGAFPPSGHERAPLTAPASSLHRPQTAGRQTP